MNAPAPRPRRARSLLLAVVICVVVPYAGILGWLKWHETDLIYRPVRVMSDVPADLGLVPERLRIADDTGAVHPLWVYRTRPAREAGWVIFLHGNAANVSSTMNVARCHQLSLLGLNVVAVEYPGFGESAGEPSEPGMVAAAMTAWRWLTDDIGVPPSRIAIYGWSLGSGAATQVAADVDEAALVLEGAFTSVADVAAEIYPYLPVRWLLRHPFASHSRIGRAGSPVLLLHARDDEVVPFAHAERLHAAATGLRQLVPLSGGHVHPNLAREDDYLRALHGFLGAALDVPLARPPRSLVSLLLDAADAGEAARAEALALAERVGAGTETGFNAASYAVGYAVRRWRSVDAAAADALAAAASRR